MFEKCGGKKSFRYNYSYSFRYRGIISEDVGKQDIYNGFQVTLT